MENLIQESSKFLSKKCHWNIPTDIKESAELKSDIVFIINQNLSIFEGIDEGIAIDYIIRDILELKSLYTLDEDEFNAIYASVIKEGWGSALLRGLGKMFGSSADDIAKGAAKGAASSADDAAKGAAKGAASSADDAAKAVAPPKSGSVADDAAKAGSSSADDAAKAATRAREQQIKVQERMRLRQERQARAQQRKIEAQQRKVEKPQQKTVQEPVKPSAVKPPKAIPKPPGKVVNALGKGLTGAAVIGTGAALLNRDKGNEPDKQQGYPGTDSSPSGTDSSPSTSKPDTKLTPDQNREYDRKMNTPVAPGGQSSADIHKDIEDLSQEDPEAAAAKRAFANKQSSYEKTARDLLAARNKHTGIDSDIDSTMNKLKKDNKPSTWQNFIRQQGDENIALGVGKE